MSLLLLALSLFCLLLVVLGYIADHVIEPWLISEERRDAQKRNRTP